MADLADVTGALSAEVDIDGDCFAPQALADLKALGELKFLDNIKPLEIPMGTPVKNAVKLGAEVSIDPDGHLHIHGSAVPVAPETLEPTPLTYYLSPDMLDSKVLGYSISAVPPHENCPHTYEEFIDEAAPPTERRLERPGIRLMEF